MILYHYTCHHGRRLIGNVGELRPHGLNGNRHAELGMPRLVWLTDMAEPWPAEALGLTSVILDCDRTKFRYRVTDTSTVIPWRRYVRLARMPDWYRDGLESEPGAMPMHWWVSRESVPVTLDQSEGWR